MSSLQKRVEINDDILNIDEEDDFDELEGEIEDTFGEEDGDDDITDVVSHSQKTSSCQRNPMGEYIPLDGDEPLTQLAVSGPGPAAYTPFIGLTKPTAPSYSIVGKSKECPVDDIPSPNCYNVHASAIWNKKVRPLKAASPTKLFCRNPFESKTCTLGSAAYKVDYYNVGRHGAKYTMASRHNDGINIGPPDVTIAPVDTKGFFAPGPNYAPEEELEVTTAVKRTKNVRPTSKCSPAPGPAEYRIPTPDRGPKYSLGYRLKVVPGFDGPGPGSYEIKSTMGDGVAPSLRQRPPSRKKYTGPAPNIYILPDTFQDSPSYSMTYRSFEVEPELLPGPANYNQNSNSVMRSAEKYSCRQQCRPSFPEIVHYPEYCLMKNKDVGPFTYNADKGFAEKNNTPSYSMGIKVEKASCNFPGPGHYDVKIPDSLKGPEFSIGNAVKTSKETIGPGPAAYKVQEKKARQGYSMSVRPKARKVQPTPAPNAYKIRKGQTSKGTANGSSVSLKSRPSPFVYSGFPNLARMTT